MRLRSLGSNQTQLDIAGMTIYFSYETPVAVETVDYQQYRTSTFFSSTTSRHLANMGVKTWEQIPQNELEAIIHSQIAA